MRRQSDSDRAYAILGLRPGSSPDEVKNRYKALTKTWHPDRWAASPVNEREAGQRMRDINWAWQTLQHRHDLPSEADGMAPRDTTADQQKFEQGLSEDEIEDIARSIESPNFGETISGFLLWAIPLAAAFVITSGHGHPLSNFWIPPTTNEKLLASGLVLFSLGVLLRRMWIKRR